MADHDGKDSILLPFVASSIEAEQTRAIWYTITGLHVTCLR